VKPISIHSGGKIAPCSVPGARARTLIRGGSTTTAPDANAIGVTAASAPSTHEHPAPPEQAVAGVLDSGHLPVVPVMFVAAQCQGVRGPQPDQLSVVLVAAQ